MNMTADIVKPLAMTEGHPSSKMSARYNYIDTEQVIQTLLQNDYKVSEIVSTRPRKKDPRIVKHFVRMRSNQYDELINGVTPEIVVVNSHDGTSALKFMAGLFRMVCSNGIIIGTNTAEPIQIRHSVIDWQGESIIAANSVIETARESARRVDIMRGRTMSKASQLEFATKVSKEVYEGKVNASDLLLSRRYEDNVDDLWTTFNRVQENVIRGGSRIQSSTGSRRRSTSRSVNAPSSSIKINNMLWNLAEEYV